MSALELFQSTTMPLKPDHLKPVTVNLDPEQVGFLEARGTRPDKGRGSRGIAPTIKRGIDFLRFALEETDVPLPENELALLERLFPDPWSADVETLQHLHYLVPTKRNYVAWAKEEGVDPDRFQRRLKALSFLSRLKIFDYLQVKATLSAGGGRIADGEE
jgi:hypothetical protein